MKFSEVVAQTLAWLQREGRVSYRALKREFGLDEEFLEDVKVEIIDAKRLAVDEEGKVLVWTGESSATSIQGAVGSSPPPLSYTPKHLAERILAEQAALEARGATDGERKTITALFADLKGSTALIEGLDPEEARAIIDPALQLMMDAVHRYEGYVAQALGDGIFALFGAPLAHEDHPQRALYAALRMQEEMHRYGDQIRLKHGVPLAMRVGINTGEVVVRSIRKDDLHTDYVPVGHSTNLAARMEQMATPGSILITEDTKRLIEGYFALKALGAAEIKGRAEPLHVYEVVGAGPLRTKLQVAARRGLTRFVGRQSEMEQLQRVLEQAKAGHGQIVGVMGEPGLGKSRLFHEFVGAYCNTPLHSQATCLVLQAYSVSHGKTSPYLPVIELLKAYFQIQSQDDERQHKEKITGKVLTLDRSLEDTLPYLFALLGVDDPHFSLQQMDPQIRRRRTFEALKRLFLRESLNQPVILIFEDLHWIDNETQGFLDTLSESVASAKVLLLVNYRPEYRQEWGQKTYYTQLRLAPFGREEAEEFLDALLGASVGADLRPKEVPVGRVGPQGQGAHVGAPLQVLKQLILERTEGTPFFMEEIVQELRERDLLSDPRRVGSAHLHVLPTTVQGLLAARIDRLAPEEKTLLQQLAVIGREFPVSLLRQVITQPEDELYRLLSSLQHKEFLHEQPAFPEVEYIFKHALTQEVAYGTVLQERRKAWHERTAQAIEGVYRDKLDDHYSALAHHYSRSGNTQKAVYYLHLAGQQAVQRSANAEAIVHLTTARELLKAWPDTSARAQQELTLLIALGPAFYATKGPGAPEVEQVYTRAQELCRQVGDTPHLFPVLRGMYSFHVTRGAFRTAHELGEQLMRLAQSIQGSAFLPEAHFAVGQTLFHFGELSSARHQYEQGIACYDPTQHRSQAFLYGQDSGVFCRAQGAWVLWVLGYPEQARQRSQEALTLAWETAHPLSLAFALMFAAFLHVSRREEQAAYERAEALIRLCTEQGNSNLLPFGTVVQGWVLAEQGGEGIAQIHDGLAALRALGVEINRPTLLAWLAEAYQREGRAEEDLNTLDEALEVARHTEERWYEAELHRLRGELTLAQSSVQRLESGVEETQKTENTDSRPLTPDPQGEAEVCFLKAIEISRRQQAKSLELRAVMSLVRLWQQQAAQSESRNTGHASRTRLNESHKLLSDVYNWFTEGFDTADLQEAKALLEALSEP